MGLSVIIPVFNGGENFKVCMQALSASTVPANEIIVVDDGSSDTSVEIARQLGADVIYLPGKPQQGPAVARNYGAFIAQNDILVFLDADVKVHPNVLGIIRDTMLNHPEITAIFGSYDDSPPKGGIVSRYKNLQHHFVHQNGMQEAATFWTGCGAIRKDAFVRLGGFSVSYRRPSIEDIELGVRIKNEGYRIWLCPEILVTHLKRWNIFNLLRSDIFDRAIPWTKLILSSAKMPSDLNLNINSRLSAVAVWAFLAFLVSGLMYPNPILWLLALVSLFFLLWLNHDFYRLVAKKEGLITCVGSILLQALYYLYSSAIFGILLIGYLVKKYVRILASFIIVESHQRTAR